MLKEQNKGFLELMRASTPTPLLPKTTLSGKVFTAKDIEKPPEIFKEEPPTSQEESDHQSDKP